MIADLAEWLTQIWEQQERAYRDAPDFVEDPTSARSPGWGNLGDECELCGAYQFSGVESVVEEAWYEHMNRAHDRQFVLADIAAKRAILAQREQVTEDLGEASADPRRQINIPILVNIALALDTTIKHLASGYAARAGYREEWRP